MEPKELVMMSFVDIFEIEEVELQRREVEVCPLPL